MEFVGGPDSCKVHIHATPVEAIAICGAMVSSHIETYFNLTDKAEVPRKVAVKPLLETLTEAFKKCGHPIKIEQEGED